MQDWDILAIQHLDFFLVECIDCFYVYLAEVQDLRFSMGDHLEITIHVVVHHKVLVNDNSLFN